MCENYSFLSRAMRGLLFEPTLAQPHTQKEPGIPNRKKNNLKFEHEWSHALNEYYEFIIFSLEADECFSIILAYD